MINRVFLDLDGVIRDWVSGIFVKFGINLNIDDITSWDFFDNYMPIKMGVSKEIFWEQQDADFWATLPFTKEALAVLEMMDAISGLGIDVCILTSPTLNSAGGTQRWIRTYLPKYFNEKRYLIGPRKEFCAGPGALLIDDAEKNVDPFTAAGGCAILFPQPWNRDRCFTKNNVELLRLMIRDIT